MDDERRFDTRAVLDGEWHPSDSHDVITPVHLSTTFELPGIDPDMDLMGLDPDDGEYVYQRIQNPTRHAVEQRLASLEGADHGFAFASGTAAINTLAMATLEPGDHLVAFDDLYGGTKKMFDRVLRDRLEVDVSYVDARETGNVADAVRDDTSLVFMETPTNPLLKLCDIGAIADVADDHGALLAVDNTFMSPYFQRPLELGADVAVASTTKYLNGHSDAVGGMLAFDDPGLADEVRFLQQVGMGNMMPPTDAYRVLRGTKTLPARMERHGSNASRIASWLDEQGAVERVIYPGLESHPQHDLAAEQMEGYGGMLSFELAGDMAAAERFLDALEQIPLAVSLGGVESLIEHPAAMTHAGLPREEREAIGITDTLLRLSVGIEDADDLIADLERGLDAV